jgi:signal transduction histidine kinase
MIPKRSLTLVLFLLLTAGCFLVIGANRMSAKYLIEVDVQRRIHQEMRVGIESCASLLGQPTSFLTCYRAVNATETSRVLSDAFLFCGFDSQSSDKRQTDACQAADVGQVNWIHEQEESDVFASFHKQPEWSREWTGLQLGPAPHGPRVLLPKQAIEGFLGELWSYRNRHLIYVLPLIFSLFVFVALATIGLVMSPIRALENSLMRMSAENLNPADGLYSKFKEFDGLTKIYMDLRHRLDESFRKARNFTAYASHELKTPLTILRGNAERLIAELPTGAPAQQRARQMADEVERLVDITDKLLTLSRADSKALLTQRADFNLSDFIHQLAEDAAAFQDDLQIESEVAQGVIWHCDPILVKQLVRNLYSNAMKYNVPQGRIRFSLQQLGDTLELTVTNTSRHLSADVVGHAFDRFFRGDPSHSRGVDGLGLGLSICLEIAHVHRGTLQFLVPQAQLATLVLRAPLHF